MWDGKGQIATTTATAALVAVVVPEALVVGLPTEQANWTTAGAGKLLDLAEGADAVLVGPGRGRRRSGAVSSRPSYPRLGTDSSSTPWATVSSDLRTHVIMQEPLQKRR